MVRVMLRCEQASELIEFVFCGDNLVFLSFLNFVMRLIKKVDFHTEYSFRKIRKLDKFNLHVDCNNIKLRRIFVVLEVIFCLETFTNSALNNVLSANFRSYIWTNNNLHA